MNPTFKDFLAHGEELVTSATAFKKEVSGYMNQGKWTVCLLLDWQPQSLLGWSCRYPYKAHDGFGRGFRLGVRIYTVLRLQPAHKTLIKLGVGVTMWKVKVLLAEWLWAGHVLSEGQVRVVALPQHPQGMVPRRAKKGTMF